MELYCACEQLRGFLMSQILHSGMNMRCNEVCLTLIYYLDAPKYSVKEWS